MIVQRQAFEYFTTPAALVASSTASNGIISWPREVYDAVQRIPSSLQTSILQDLRISFPDLEGLSELKAFIEVNGQSRTDDEERTTVDSDHLLRNALHLALWLCNQCRQQSLQQTLSPSISYIFRNFLHGIIDSIMPIFSVQERVEYAAPRGQSAKLNFLPGLSVESRSSPIIVLYDIKTFEEPFSSLTNSNLNMSENLARSEDASLSSLTQGKREEGLNDLRSHDDEMTGYHLSTDGKSNAIIKNDQDSPEMPSKLHIDLEGISKDAYLLAETHLGKPPCIPVLCAGSMSELEPLMLSAVYQRSVWGIMEPLIGFSWDSTGLIITTVFGWMDNKGDEDGRLPNVHITYADEGPGNSVFDMRDPVSVLRLVMFIWNTREDLYRITTELESAVPKVVQAIRERSLMQWRADTTPQSLNTDQLTRQDIFLRWCDSASPSKDDLVEFPQLMETLLEGHERTYLSRDVDPSEKADQARHHERSRSYFQEDENFLSTPMDDRWLQDRRVYSVCPSNHKIPLRHNVMMKFDHYTQFYTLPQDAECLLDTPQCFESSAFLEEIRRYGNTQSDNQVLERDTWNHMAPHLGMISLACSHSRQKMEFKAKHRLAKFDCHTEWESLISCLFHQSHDCHYNLRVECVREVNLPRNVASDLLPFTYSDWRTCTAKFLGFTSFIEAQTSEWSTYEAMVRKAGAPQDVINQAYKRATGLAHRSAWFFNDENKRHIWRSLQRDPVQCRPHCMGILSIESLDLRLIGGLAISDDQSTNHYHSDIYSSTSKLPSDLLLPISRDSAPSNSPLELAVLYLGYSSRATSHSRQIPQTSMNHVRMNLVAGVTHLASLGIIEFPLFGVAIEGNVGTVVCAWCGPLESYGKIESCVYILDDETVQYDLASPTGIYNYSTFISMLTTKHAPALAARLTERWKGSSELSGKDWAEIDWIRSDWTMAEQVNWYTEQGYLDDFDKT